jgi:hypothetical protein
MSYTDITTGVTFLGEFASEEFIKFSAEDTICDKLALFADLGGHFEGCSKKDGVSQWSSQSHPKCSMPIQPNELALVVICRNQDIQTLQTTQFK